MANSWIIIFEMEVDSELVTAGQNMGHHNVEDLPLGRTGGREKANFVLFRSSPPFPVQGRPIFLWTDSVQ